jgi:hypothetical protein
LQQPVDEEEIAPGEGAGLREMRRR